MWDAPARRRRPLSPLSPRAPSTPGRVGAALPPLPLRPCVGRDVRSLAGRPTPPVLRVRPRRVPCGGGGGSSGQSGRGAASGGWVPDRCRTAPDRGPAAGGRRVRGGRGVCGETSWAALLHSRPACDAFRAQWTPQRPPTRRKARPPPAVLVLVLTPASPSPPPPPAGSAAVHVTVRLSTSARPSSSPSSSPSPLTRTRGSHRRSPTRFYRREGRVPKDSGSVTRPGVFFPLFYARVDRLGPSPTDSGRAIGAGKESGVET